MLAAILRDDHDGLTFRAVDEPYGFGMRRHLQRILIDRGMHALPSVRNSTLNRC